MKGQASGGPGGVTELEASVLGMLGVKGPCTPYALRREFRASPSQYWSASSGAVYPLILRLRRRGLIRVTRKVAGRRGGLLYELTPAGRRVLRDWLGTLDAPASISVPPDPLRNRIAFFELLDEGERRSYLAAAVRGMRAYLSRVRSYTEQLLAQGRHGEHLVSAGAQRMVQARLDWLLEVARTEGLDVSTPDG
jgi:DNA-binding PadR family transcriptional regulator